MMFFNCKKASAVITVCLFFPSAYAGCIVMADSFESGSNINANQCDPSAQETGWFASPTGSKTGKGTKNSPWDLQTALNGGPNKEVKAGDNIWLLDGQYNGRFLSTLESLDPSKPITVSSYPNHWAVLNGNIPNPGAGAVLTVEGKGGNVIYKDFEITHVGNFTRDMNHKDFHYGVGLNHKYGEDCKFVNLVIHDNPSTGVGSWKATGGSQFYGNLVYNNGNLDFRSGKKRNHGPAFYVQNASDKVRLFENNVVFNNISHGYEIWSANHNAGDNSVKEYVKNITLRNNSIFNNALGYTSGSADVVISTLDKSGFNVPKNIIIHDNEIYKNQYSPSSGYGSAIRLNEFSSKVSPLKNIIIEDNLLVSRNQSFIIGKTESLTFRNNLLVTGFLTVRDASHQIMPYKNWNFANNTYYTKSNSFMRINGDSQKKYSFDQWQSPPFNLDKQGSTFSRSATKPAPKLTSQKRISIIHNQYKPTRFKVSIFHGNGENLNQDVAVDFSSVKNIESFVGRQYKIFDVENYPAVMASGQLSADKTIKFDLAQTEFNKPRGNDLNLDIVAGKLHKFEKTFKNYGVFWVDFDVK